MKRYSNKTKLFLSPSIHHIRHRKQYYVNQQEALNQNRSVSPVQSHQRLQIKSICSSYTSLNSYLKEFHLSEKDFLDLRQALKTIFHFIQLNDHNYLVKQRLTSPYLQQQLNNDDQSSLPLYTDEHFIRNGLLNHNDGPNISDNHCQYSSKSPIHSRSYLPSLSSSMMLTSSMNITLPLALLSNQNYFFNALTSNFVADKFQRSQSNIELNMNNYLDKEDESESIIVRRNKVQTWKRDNILQHRPSIVSSSIKQNKQFDVSKYHQDSIIQASLTSKDDESIRNVEEFNINKRKENENLSEIKMTDDLFPMIKQLAPYIIIHNSSCSSKNMNEMSDQHVKHLARESKKRSLTNVLHPMFSSAKRRSLMFPSLANIDRTLQINNKKLIQQEKKNYLLAEFESVLTEISKR